MTIDISFLKKGNNGEKKEDHVFVANEKRPVT